MRAFIGGVGRTVSRSGLRFSTAVTRGKTSTGLVGLAVDKNGRETLLNLSAQVLESVKVRARWDVVCTMPPTKTDSSSPPFVENTTGQPVPRGRGEVVQLLHQGAPSSPPPPQLCFPCTPLAYSAPRLLKPPPLQVATSTPDIAAIEAEIALGQIEEVIEMVKVRADGECLV